MAIEFFRRAPGKPAKLGILPGAFNPPTRAHLALARAGLEHTDEVLFILPRAFPHKPFEHAAFDDRLRMLLATTADESRFSVGSAAGGLYVEIARECREAYGADAQVAALCGRDAAERILTWDYGDPDAARKMLDEFELLVAGRQGNFEPPADLRHRIRTFPLPPGCDEVSATQVRDSIARGEPWRHLVPESIADLVAKLYQS